MSAWVDFAVYAALIAAVWGWCAAALSRLMIPVIADRNPRWIAEHPEFSNAAGIPARRLARAAGASTATARWEALKDLNSVLFLPGLVLVAESTVLFYRRGERPARTAPRGDTRP